MQLRKPSDRALLRALELLIHAAKFRCSMPISKIRRLPNGSGYFVCPRCDSDLDRDFVAFCGYCGQRLDWSSCENAKAVYIGNIYRQHY